MVLTEAAENFLSKALGEEGLEELRKFELYKLKTNTVLDPNEIRIALQIVPRTVLSMLQMELAPMKDGSGRQVPLPVNPPANLSVTKMARDVYTGEIHQEGKVIASFKDRSLPGVGLVIMSTFELYDIGALASMPAPRPEPEVSKIQAMIDERLVLRDLVRQVVDQRISDREAIDHMIRMRLTQAIREAKKKAEDIATVTEAHKQSTPMSDPYFHGMANGLEVANSIANDKEPKFVEAPKASRLKAFLGKRKKNREFQIMMSKNETVSCPDCGQAIFAKGSYSGCVCLGADMNNKIYIKKTEEGFSARFPKSWDQENILMLLEVLRSKNRSEK